MTLQSPTFIPSPSSPQPTLSDGDNSEGKDKQLPRGLQGFLPAVQPPERPGDDVVMGVARSQSKKGRVLRKQSRNCLKNRKAPTAAKGKEKEEEDEEE
jgi:hypothetical protein